MTCQPSHFFITVTPVQVEIHPVLAGLAQVVEEAERLCDAVSR